jgi:hypothetical protein
VVNRLSGSLPDVFQFRPAFLPESTQMPKSALIRADGDETSH